MSEANSRPVWHALPVSELIGELATTEHGITTAEAAKRIATYGPNRLPQRKPPTWWEILLRQFRSPLIYILAVAAVLSLTTGHLSDAAFIAAVLLLNAIIGSMQEWKAERSAQALQQLLKVRASVERDGDISEIDADELVPGDVVWLESGNRVPADLRLLGSHGLEIDESLLTGESFFVGKNPADILEATTPVADRSNMTHAGSIVARGRAHGVVVATGTATAVGQLALDVLGADSTKPPLVLRMERFTRAIAVAVLVAAVGIAVLGIVVRGQGLTETLMFAVALAVSAIPEGLPVAMTVALAIATTRMARRGVIVRRLTAVEGLGSCTLVATDKTGTLTANELTVREIRLADGGQFNATGEGFAPVGEVCQDENTIQRGANPLLDDWTRVAVLCNEGDLHHRNGDWVWRGDPVDVAFLSVAHKLGRSREAELEISPQVNEIGFEPEHQFAASYHQRSEGGTFVTVKGAPERVLAMSDLTAEQRRQQLLSAEEMASRGFRVLALADGEVRKPVTPEEAPPTPSGLRFLGFAAMIDPLRPGVREAVQGCLKAGVQVCMVTGDHRITALAIARDLGFATGEENVMTGEMLDTIPEAELPARVKQTAVFARVAPHQKLQIVEAAKQAGHFVAVTGDGVNDAPALRVAHIGVAMGRSGTDVAREASDLVISDDNFATIVGGIEEGRVAYDNVRKVIYLLISTGAAEIVLVALAMLCGTPLPLLPVQLLWLNLVTNGVQDVALAFEPGEPDVLQRRPRPPTQHIFDRLMIERTVVAAAVMGLVGFGLFSYLLPADYTPAELASAQNMLLLLMVLFENVHIGNCRSETRSGLLLSPLRSPILLIGVMVAFGIHLAAMYLPVMQGLLGTEAVDFSSWALLLGLALSVFAAIELHKLSWRWRAGNSASDPSAGLQSPSEPPD